MVALEGQTANITARVFTGIIEETGLVQAVSVGPASTKLAVSARSTVRGLKIGDSLAVNGCCLTVAKLISRGKKKSIEMDLLRETWERTNLRFTKKGSLVNLERPLRADSRLDGHFVTGHIDGTGKITRWERSGQDRLLEIAAPAPVMRYVVFKGSIAIDGISLTVAVVTAKTFRVWIIPHTFEVTALRERAIGDAVNLEADILGKYVEKFTASRAAH